MMLTRAETFRGARAILETGGWCQGSYQADDGSHCVVGAMMAAGSDRGKAFHHAAYQLLAQVIGTTIGAVSVQRWNDDQERTLADVLAALDAAAVIAEQQDRAAELKVEINA